MGRFLCFEGCLLLFILSTSNLLLAFSKRYDWNSSKLFSSMVITNTITPINGAMAYALVSNGSTDIVSDNGTFAFAFLEKKEQGIYYTPSYFVPLDTPTFFVPRMLAVVMQKKVDSNSIAAVPVWKTYLSDSLYKFDCIDLDETGNMAWYYRNKLVWQSFDYPGDILLPGQQLRNGTTLTAEQDSNLVAQVAGGGFILAQGNLDSYSALPYGIWILGATQENTVDALVEQAPCIGYETVVNYTGNELKLFYEKKLNSGTPTNISCELPAVSLPLKVNISSDIMILPYLQLVSSGNLVIFKYNSAGSSWTAASKLFQSADRCHLPFPCSEYYEEGRMICDSTKNQCTMLSNVQNGTNSSFVKGVSHFTVKFRRPVLKNVSLEGCENLFRSYSEVLIYDSVTRDCFTVTQLLYQTFYRDNTTVNMTALFDRVFYITPAFPFWFGGSVTVLWLIAITALVIVKYEIPAIVKHRVLDLGVKYAEDGAAVIKYTFISTRNKFNKKIQETESLLSSMQGLPRRYSYLELENATKGFSTKLGAGGYGSVYEGTTLDGKHVAVKKLANIDKKVIKPFVTEIVSIGGISHVNIVKLFGFCIEGNAKRLLVYEFMPNGSLDGWIFSQDKSLGWHQRLDIALGTAQGLRYLHEECSEPILHLDVKPQNILLDENFVPKVADFGMAKLLEHRDMTHATTTVRGTFGYMAPEWLMQSVATKKCDVYSYGLVLLEIIGGRRNTHWSRVGDDDNDDFSWYFPSWTVQQVKAGKVVEVWDEKVRSFAAENARQAISIVHLALWCIQNNPTSRPSFTEIVEILEGRRLVGEPPMSFHFNFQLSMSEGRDQPSSSIFKTGLGDSLDSDSTALLS